MSAYVLEPELTQKALPHFKKLLKFVECHVCSSTLLTPLVASCGHSACARCWARSPACCPLCACSTTRQKIRPNLPLAKRAAAVLRLATAVQKVIGVEITVSTPSSGTVNFPKTDEDSEECFYQKDKKFSKKYEKKNRESSVGKLLSVSQDEPPLVFPGEDIDVNRGNGKSSSDSKPDAVDKVKGWLKSSQNHFGSEEERISVSNIHNNTIVPPPKELTETVFVNEMYEDFFSKKITTEVLEIPQIEPIVSINQPKVETVNPKSLVPNILKDFASEESSECSPVAVIGCKSMNGTLTQRQCVKSISESAICTETLHHSDANVASRSHSFQSLSKNIILNDIEMHSECSSKSSLKSAARDKTLTLSNSIEIIPETVVQRETSYKFASYDNVIPSEQSSQSNSTCLPVKRIINSDIEILHSDGSIPFVRQISSTAAHSKKVPFFYKSKCNPNISCTEQQDGLNIEITRDNVVTTIVIRNYPLVQLSGKGQCHVKVARTRDAQTSPIPFTEAAEMTETTHKQCQTLMSSNLSTNNIPATQNLQDNPQVISKIICGDVNSINSTSFIKRTHVNSCTDTYEITESLEKEMKENDLMEGQSKILSRAPSAVLASSSSLKFKTHQQFDNNSAKLMDSIPLVLNEGRQCEVSQIGSVIGSSPPLQVTGPDEPSFKPYSYKKRKCFEERNDANKSDSKKAKTDKMDDDLIISFESETQGSLQVQPAQMIEPESERMNYDEIKCTVFGNIDKDLKFTKNTSNKNKEAPKKVVINDNGVVSSQILSEMFEKSERVIAPSAKDIVGVEGIDNSHQNKEGITDFRNLSMDIELDVKFSDNMFSTMYDRHTIAFNTQSNIPLSNPSTQILSEVERNGRVAPINKGPQERSIELSPDEQMLLTPTTKVGESLQMGSQVSPQSPRVDKIDSDSSMVEDTPPKPRKVNILRKVQDKPLLAIRKPAQSDNADISNIRRLELSQVDKLTSEKISAEKVWSIEIGKGEMSSSKRNNTPLSITKFTSDVKFRSTPMQAPARRSLTYNETMSKIAEDDERSVDSNPDDQEIQYISERINSSRQSSTHTKTSIEREFLEQAFDVSERGPAEKSGSGRQSTIIGFTNRGGMLRTHDSQSKLLTKVLNEARNKSAIALEENSKNTVLCIATSCLPKDQMTVVREFVNKMGWKFTDQYSKGLTHLVVKVDENNVSQRTVKYMQALADGKWIVSFDWITQCLQNGKHINEEKYEVLDSSGEMGPRLSRIAGTKLFKGITFYCLPPITTPDEEILINILKAAGGVVAQSIEQVEIRNPKSLFILLADPQNTQDERCIDLCLRHPLVPLNVEWTLDCLGQGCLEGAAGYLMAPRTLLPPVDWPFSLASEESMEAAN